MKFSIGETVGAYRILQELGHGGMGRVFKVEHTITRRLEAMKVLEGGRPDAPEQAARSLREIQLQASLDHANIAAVHNAFWVGENLVLVMELIEGCSLRSVLEAQRLPLTTAVNYARQALAALSHAHAHGVIHRDISPANMMIGPSGVLKLTDFGLAKELADVQVSRSGAPLGSLHYMSPEQVRGAEADARSDIYSFGAVLYELVTGKKPFDGESAFAIMASQVNQPPVPPIEVESSLSHPLNSAILRSLEKDPAQRFPSAEEFLQALMPAQNVTAASRLASSPSILRSRAVWAAGSVALVSLAIVSLIDSQGWHWPGKPPAAAVVHHPDSPVHESDKSAQAPPEPIAPAPVPVAARTVHSQPPTVTKRPPSESPTMTTAAREPASAPATEDPDLGIQSSEQALLISTPAEEDSDTTAKRGRNPFIKALGKIWHLGRHKETSSGHTPQHSSGSSAP